MQAYRERAKRSELARETPLWGFAGKDSRGDSTLSNPTKPKVEYISNEPSDVLSVSIVSAGWAVSAKREAGLEGKEAEHIYRSIQLSSDLSKSTTTYPTALSTPFSNRSNTHIPPSNASHSHKNIKRKPPPTVSPSLEATATFSSPPPAPPQIGQTLPIQNDATGDSIDPSPEVARDEPVGPHPPLHPEENRSLHSAISSPPRKASLVPSSRSISPTDSSESRKASRRATPVRPPRRRPAGAAATGQSDCRHTPVEASSFVDSVSPTQKPDVSILGLALEANDTSGEKADNDDSSDVLPLNDSLDDSLDVSDETDEELFFSHPPLHASAPTDFFDCFHPITLLRTRSNSYASTSSSNQSDKLELPHSLFPNHALSTASRYSSTSSLLAADGDCETLAEVLPPRRTFTLPSSPFPNRRASCLSGFPAATNPKASRMLPREATMTRDSLFDIADLCARPEPVAEDRKVASSRSYGSVSAPPPYIGGSCMTLEPSQEAHLFWSSDYRAASDVDGVGMVEKGGSAVPRSRKTSLVSLLDLGLWSWTGRKSESVDSQPLYLHRITSINVRSNQDPDHAFAPAKHEHNSLDCVVPAPMDYASTGAGSHSAYNAAQSSSTWQPLPSQYLPTPPTSLAFDPLSPLLFAASPTGTVASYFCSPTTGLSGRYTSYVGHHGPVGECAIDSTGILTVGGGGMAGRSGRGGSVKMANRRGIALWTVETDPPAPLTTFAYTPSRSSEIIVTGPGSDVYAVNVNRGSIVRRQTPPIPILHLRRSTQLVASTLSGSLALLDPRTSELTVQESVLAHTGGINQIETEGNYIVTVGFTSRQGLPLPDPFLKLHDARYLRPMSPIPFPTPPSLVKFHPRISSTVIVSTAEGRVQMLDLRDVSKGSVFQVETPSYLSSMAIAPTGEGLAFGDADGYVHLWAAQEDSKFCRFEGEVEMPDTVDPPERIDWRDTTPLNVIGMPYYTTPLLSLLPSSHDYQPSPTHHTRPQLNPEILSTVKQVDFVGYAPYPASARAAGRRNQAVGVKGGEDKTKRRVDVPMFRSEKERQEGKKKARDRAQSVDELAQAEEDFGSQMPSHYRKVEIKYSRFGVEDFDFGFYNKTAYSGLETHITNSYTNALLQALHYTKPVRMLAEAHTFSACTKENCLFCEAGFLFRMLGDAKGRNCQASNFSRAFGASPQVAALGLMDHDSESSTVAYASLIQTFNRFLLEQMTAESDAPPAPQPSLIKSTPGPSFKPPLAQLLKIEARTVSLCTQCGAANARDTAISVVDLIYPRRALSNELPPPSDYASILRNSLHRETIARMVCTTCRQSNHLRLKRVLSDAPLPPVLCINAGVRTSDELEFWQDGRLGEGERFLEKGFWLGKKGEGVLVNSAQEKVEDAVRYELQAMVVQIQAEGEASHLVAIARVGDAGAWHVFNDFLVKPISEQEALSFSSSWKIPAVLFYQRTDATDLLDFSTLPLAGDPEILCHDITISRNRDPALVKHTPLKSDEFPKRGTLISIDAEFVSLQQEEADYHSDGTKNVIRPSRMTLARVSVLRGEGEQTGVPFIDDHIHTSDTVVDYLTEFSGIRAGDLDPFGSKHTLVPLKVAYKKLRLLVDLGCVFIGHGLNKDFRIINIFIPPEQIIDTVDIYHLAHRQRKLSLRFLAWAVLHSAIQSDTHDSIEDARTALQLYEQHNRLEAEGRWDDALEDVYREGRLTNFKVPGAEPHGGTATPGRPSTPTRENAALPSRSIPPSPYRGNGRNY